MSSLVCPECHDTFQEEQEFLLCKKCGGKYPVIGGVPVIKKKTDKYFYDFEFSENTMADMLKNAEEKGWRQALFESSTVGKKNISDYSVFFSTDERRACWKYLLPDLEKSTVLDYGCGMGSISSSLASLASHVVSFEPTYERVKMWEIRAKQDGKTNVEHICGGGEDIKLPFRNEFFDVVVVNGVLEWVATSLQGRDPREIQQSVLKEICRVTKKGGMLYLAIENRYAAKYFMGKVDHHSGLKYVTFLPRVIANIYSKIIAKKEYRTYLHSWKGLENMALTAGYDTVKVYYPHPTYAQWRYFVDFDDREILVYLVSLSPKSSIASAIVKLAIHSGLFKFFVYSYGIMARKAI